MKTDENNEIRRIDTKKLARDITDRLFRNESKLEAAIFFCALLFAVVSSVLDIITGIAAGGVWNILRPLTVGLVLLLLRLLLPVSDSFFVVRGKSLILLAYSAVSIMLCGIDLGTARGVWNIILAVLGLIAALALYGTLIVDQFATDDKPAKYWLIYGGALYFILYSPVILILDGIRATGVLGALDAVFGGLASIFVMLMLLCLFDSLSFAEYMFSEIVDAGDDADTGEDTKSAGSEDSADDDITVAIRDGQDEEDNREEEEYVPYEEEQPAEVLTEQDEPADKPSEQKESEDIPDEEVYKPFDDIVNDYDASVVAVSDEVEDTESSGSSGQADEAGDDASGEPSGSIPEGISPTELKYARFAAAHHKPDETLQVTGMSGDLFDVWVDGDTICFLNDLGQAIEGRGVRTAVIPFADVSGLRLEKLEDGAECVVLTYEKDGEPREIRFTKESFGNFKRVMEQAAGE